MTYDQRQRVEERGIRPLTERQDEGTSRKHEKTEDGRPETAVEKKKRADYFLPSVISRLTFEEKEERYGNVDK
jgi:squalene cyclase